MGRQMVTCLYLLPQLLVLHGEGLHLALQRGQQLLSRRAQSLLGEQQLCPCAAHRCWCCAYEPAPHSQERRL